MPNITSNQCYVRVTDANDASRTDQSDNPFALNTSVNIVVISPNGGEDWQAEVDYPESGGSAYYMNTNSGATVCNGTFYDPGGTNYYYSYDNHTRTFTPSISGHALKFTFTSFYTYDYSDYLQIYNGANTSAPLIGTYYGYNSPGTVVANNPVSYTHLRAHET